MSAAIVVGAAPAFGDSAAVSAKKAEARRVLGEINQLDGSLERAIEAYNLATDKLNRIQSDLRINLRELHVARSNLHHSQRVMSERLITLYTTGDATSSLGILLGAGDITDLLGRVETVNSVSGQDVQINHQVVSFKSQVREHRARLKNARAEQRQLVQERASQKASIESQLAERRRLVASIRQEIVHIKQEEARRQAELAAQARARAAAAQAAPPAVLSASLASSESFPAPPPSANSSTVVAIAMRYLGVPYVWGGASPSGFDCSGFTLYVYAQVGISLPHYAASQYGMGSPVSRDQLQPGDLVFFNGLGHMGMYIGGGNFIHAPHTGDVVKISSLSDSWYASTYVGARRL